MPGSGGILAIFKTHKLLSICSACGRRPGWSNEDCASRIIVGMPNHGIEDPFVIAKILFHLEGRGGAQESATRHFIIKKTAICIREASPSPEPCRDLVKHLCIVVPGSNLVSPCN